MQLPIRLAAASRIRVAAWVLRDYGLTVSDLHIALVKRKRGIMKRTRFEPVPESMNPCFDYAGVLYFHRGAERGAGGQHGPY